MDEESGDDVFVAALPAALWAQCKTGVWAWRRREVRWSRAEEGGRSRAWQGAPDADNALDSEETLRFVEWDAPNTAVATQRLFLQYRLSLGCGSWLLMRQTPLTTVATPPAGSPPDWMIRDGSIRIMLPVDPVLVAIPILERYVGDAAAFRTWTQLMADCGAQPWIGQHLSEARHAELVMQKRAADVPTYRFCRRRALAYLLCKYRAIRNAMRGGHLMHLPDAELLDLFVEVVGQAWVTRLTAVVHGKGERGNARAATERD
ncbi:hypothetical protein CDCA_CDCA08G2418 [Cyanidium caldarium]|uniref:Uncharacterized protein n=1 Tax=Cyanidium caldarium TaxID=2771 RepID=A0AAV9IWD6_CYACA|nr:hypothetical protein CDCA_CDCA08G2418 [Cyanidium caldarium]